MTMTNVKLKLMFYLLNALLTVDFATSRPYSDIANDTEAVVDPSSNTTAGSFNIPVDSNADTLMVAEEEDALSKASYSDAKTEMESIMNAEQNRDETLLKKVIKEAKNILNISKGDADALNKQLKVSSPVLEDIIDAETGREETLTDIIQYRPDPEFEELPSFEFLVAAKPNNTGVLVKVNASGDLRDLDDALRGKSGNGSELFRKIDYVELVEVVKQNGENKSAYNLANMTGHDIENDSAPDTRYTDVQTLFLACFGTLLPLMTILCIMLVVSICGGRRVCLGSGEWAPIGFDVGLRRTRCGRKLPIRDIICSGLREYSDL
ncbi:hypothetical protein EVAR_94398_1 [Eumeta japonica]|uniref:Uncharacterized protein n=1 Tax=Eumeta variegata TaxID=151549 RepID=A0A4C1TQ12_EUMVA|nr:hypothetical protein EVAR_94398_1 [Eumeta japonica]